MFRTAEIGRTLEKSVYKEQEEELRQDLLQLQQQLLKHKQFSVLVVFAGVDGGGKGDSVNIFNEWMDARWLISRAYRTPSEEEKERPEYWRYWRDLPPKGQIGLFLSSWYSRPLLDFAYNKIDTEKYDRKLDRIIGFENALAEDGCLILKFWMHLSRDAQKARFKSLEKDPLLRWQVTEKDWAHWKIYDSFINAAEHCIMRSNTGNASWCIVEGVDAYYRRIFVGTQLRDALRKHLQKFEAAKNPPAENNDNVSDDIPDGHITVLSQLDLDKQLSKEKYKSALKKHQAKLNLLHQQAVKKGVSTIIVFEGPDAAGKGGAIRRVIRSMDAHNYRVLPFSAPSDEERAQHYLWRFWRQLSRAGYFSIFDRSWYGRVLVERVEGFAKEIEWRRAYAEINDFEDQLIDHGIVLVKIWLHISKDEQLIRFKERESTPIKSWKLTDEDWRNREKWEDYEIAAHDMIQYTSTQQAPWEIIAGNNKHYARIQVLKTIIERLQDSLKK